MADLLRGFHFAEAYRFLQTQLRSYTMPARPHVRFLLWNPVPIVSGIACQAPFIRDSAGLLRRRWIQLQETMTPPWVAPDPELQLQMRARIEAALLRS